MKKHHEVPNQKVTRRPKCNSFHSDLVYQCTPLRNIATYITRIVTTQLQAHLCLRKGTQRLVLSIQVLDYAYKIMYCGNRSVKCHPYIFDVLLLASDYVLGWIQLWSLTGYCDGI